MKFVDQATISLKAGDGGPGAVSFRREKYAPKGGPDGGDGGQGGAIILEASENIQTLLDLKIKRKYKAKNGQPGNKKNKSGKAGDPLVIKVPVGCILYDKEDRPIEDLDSPGKQIIVVKGGKGGKGNQHFATSTNRVPRYAQPGTAGEEATIRLELKLLAEVGLLGFPNAGKSTLLKALTRANPKIANYPFTTLYPNLGVLKFVDKEIIIADIPGIIKGASKGEGLGLDFMRHIERTKVLLHVCDVSSGSPEDIIEKYNAIVNETTTYNVEIAKKPMHIILNKIDLIDDKALNSIQKAFSKLNLETTPISGLLEEGLTPLIQLVIKSLK